MCCPIFHSARGRPGPFYMNEPDRLDQFLLNIGAVERETGLSKDTLRIWERRYHFPQPERDRFGERTYSLAQVEKLRLLKRLLALGLRPGKIVGLSIEELRNMTPEQGAILLEPSGSSEGDEDLGRFIDLCKSHRFDEVRRELSRMLLRLGMYRFVMDVIAPLSTMVGAHWANGSFAVFEEHLYTETVQTIMRNAISAIPSAQPGSAARPRILLTTFSQEQHSLGLLMAEAIFALEGAHCISLGVQTPILDMVQAAQTQRADIVALSCSVSMNPNHVIEGLQRLRAELPDDIEIWVGGRCSALYRRAPPGAQVLDLQDIHALLTDWRRKHKV